MVKKRAVLVLLVIIMLSSFPVHSQGYENTNVFKLVGQGIFYLVIFIAMIFLTLYGTKLVAKNAGGMAKSKYIQLIDAINITSGSKIIIAKINNKIYILTTSNNGSDIIDIIEEEDFPIIEENFDNYLDKNLIVNKLSNSKLNKSIKLFYDKHINKRIKNKEDKKDEKED